MIIDNAFIASVGTTEIDAVIPADANLGPHTMRFKANWNSPVPDDACEVTSYGEVEDYTITIVESLSTNDYQLEGLKIYPNPVDGDFVTIKSPIAGDKFINLILMEEKYYQQPWLGICLIFHHLVLDFIWLKFR